MSCTQTLYYHLLCLSNSVNFNTNPHQIPNDFKHSYFERALAVDTDRGRYICLVKHCFLQCTHGERLQSSASDLMRLLTVPAQQAEISSLQQLLLTKNAEIENLHTQLSARPSSSPESSERGKARRRAASSPTGDGVKCSFSWSRNGRRCCTTWASSC